MNHYDEDDAAYEYFSKRKDRRKPKGRRSVKTLRTDKTTAKVSSQVFDDDSLQHLYERGFITELVGELKSGKEATVYLVEGPKGLLAAKVYSDKQVSPFRNDRKYREGRYIADQRIKKAIDKRSVKGVSAQQAIWVFHEYKELWALYEAGLPVPEPVVGPGADDIVQAGRTVLMAYLGTNEYAAPRLSDVRLSPEKAERAWQESVAIMRRLLTMGKIHGDLSTYNLLWWQNRVYVIDFPQMVDIETNRNAPELLEQDVNSLTTSFRRLGIRADPDVLLREMRALVRSS